VSGQDPFIDETVRARIGLELDRIEREQNVRILLAAESGSRAWRFASPDSDYDVRFIYVRRLEDYVSIETPRDVIERPLDAVLDINGWDLRKALQLMMKSNAVLLEWLSSPVRYRADDDACRQLGELARADADLTALAFHYDRLARGAWSPAEGEQNPIRLKSYFYALRPALALLWLRDHGAPPPMDLPRLMDGAALSQELRAAIGGLLELKTLSLETATAVREPIIESFLSEILAVEAEPPGRRALAESRVQADRLFRRAAGVEVLEIPTKLA